CPRPRFVHQRVHAEPEVGRQPQQASSRPRTRTRRGTQRRRGTFLAAPSAPRFSLHLPKTASGLSTSTELAGPCCRRTRALTRSIHQRRPVRQPRKICTAQQYDDMSVTVDHHHPPGPDSPLGFVERARHRAPALAGLPDVLAPRHPEGVAEHDDAGGHEDDAQGARSGDDEEEVVRRDGAVAAFMLGQLQKAEWKQEYSWTDKLDREPSVELKHSTDGSGEGFARVRAVSS
ncbi:hypothetical protein CTA1_8036, partial [Colletotrichum tanaceti]